MRKILRYSFAAGVPRRSIVVAIIVGAILNLINQGDAILAGRDIDVAKMLLTFCVPYCVATYGAVSFRMGLEKSEASRDAG